MNIFIIGIMIFFTTLLQADSYLLTMSKDDKVCQHMYKLFNGDLHEKGKLMLQEHEEFSSIRWEKGKFNIQAFHDYHYDAEFDINNDGRKELVVFRNKRLEEKVDDALFYFSMDMKDKMSGENQLLWSDTFKNKLFKGKLSQPSYQLKEYPVQKEYTLPYLGLQKDIPLMAKPYINSFKFEDKYYITLVGNVNATTQRKDTIDQKNSIIIQKFTSKNEEKDICYYVKVTENKGKR